MEIEQLMDESQGLELTEDNIETVLDEIRPYLVGKKCLAAHDCTTYGEAHQWLPSSMIDPAGFSSKVFALG